MSERYRVADPPEVLGSGAFGVVVKAIDTKTGALVALKFILQSVAEGNPLQGKRVVREIKLLSTLRHSNS